MPVPTNSKCNMQIYFWLRRILAFSVKRCNCRTGTLWSYVFQYLSSKLLDYCSEMTESYKTVRTSTCYYNEQSTASIPWTCGRILICKFITTFLELFVFVYSSFCLGKEYECDATTSWYNALLISISRCRVFLQTEINDMNNTINEQYILCGTK